MKFIITSEVDSVTTGRKIGTAETIEEAGREIARVLSVGDYLREGERVAILPRDKFTFQAGQKVAIEEMMRAAILGPDSVMNSDF